MCSGEQVDKTFFTCFPYACDHGTVMFVELTIIDGLDV